MKTDIVSAGWELAAANRTLSSRRAEESVDLFNSEDAPQHWRVASNRHQFQGQKGTSPRTPMLWASLRACTLMRHSYEERRIVRVYQPPPGSQVMYTQPVGHSRKSPSVSLSSKYRCFQVTFRAFVFRQHSF